MTSCARGIREHRGRGPAGLGVLGVHRFVPVPPDWPFWRNRTQFPEAVRSRSTRLNLDLMQMSGEKPSGAQFQALHRNRWRLTDKPRELDPLHFIGGTTGERKAVGKERAGRDVRLHGDL